LDLALSSSPHPEHPVTNGWGNTIGRHRHQHSLSALNGSSTQTSDIGSIGSRPTSLRQPIDLKFIAENSMEGPPAGVLASPGSHVGATPPKLQSSFSANDVPTIKNGSGQNAANNNNNANNHAQQHFHNHNASIGRIPTGIVPTRHTRELSGDSNINGSREQSFQSLQSALQASAAPFGPSAVAVAPQTSSSVTSPVNATAMNPYNGYFPGNGFQQAPTNNGNNSGANNNNNNSNFGMPLLAAGMQQLSMNNGAGNGMYPQQNFQGYGNVPFSQGAQPRDSQARVIQNRRQLDNEGLFIPLSTPSSHILTKVI
jgi:hypothetical protein